ncbi:hypothetical protein SKAU_G00045310 [Synaphobranchus kaupii]|uniref:Sushi domain-containing protein n=1 Tax=Synaphobranchus kaupii TaxID=118154 RepID=A0A9Q1J845_SYNKA|nr:hypothetical protein SKAU_G00045310 [Synaphobranchus kaupii]
MSGNANVTHLFFMLLSLTSTCHYGILCAGVIVESCPPPPQKDKTKPFNQTQLYQEDQKYYYTCIDGYIRKAGTSTLIRCRRNGKALVWNDDSRPTSLICIPDPKIKKPPEEPKTTTLSVTTVTITMEKSTPRTTPVIAATIMQKTTVQPSPLATTTEPINPGPDKRTQGETTAIYLGVIILVILLVALIVVVLLKLKNQGRLRFPLAEQIPMAPTEPQDRKYIRVAQQEL